MSTDLLRVDWLAQELTAPGRLGITMAPGRRGRSLNGATLHARDTAADYAELKRLGVGLVVCLQEPHEGAHIAEGKRCADELEIEMSILPIPDGEILWSAREMQKLIWRISLRLDDGKSIVVHCAGGLGRSGLVVGCWLRSQGASYDDALWLLSSMRGPRCPENDLQRAAISWWPTLPPMTVPRPRLPLRRRRTSS